MHTASSGNAEFVSSASVVPQYLSPTSYNCVLAYSPSNRGTTTAAAAAAAAGDADIDAALPLSLSASVGNGLFSPLSSLTSPGLRALMRKQGLRPGSREYNLEELRSSRAYVAAHPRTAGKTPGPRNRGEFRDEDLEDEEEEEAGVVDEEEVISAGEGEGEERVSDVGAKPPLARPKPAAAAGAARSSSLASAGVERGSGAAVSSDARNDASPFDLHDNAAAAAAADDDTTPPSSSQRQQQLSSQSSRPFQPAALRSELTLSQQLTLFIRSNVALHDAVLSFETVDFTSFLYAANLAGICVTGAQLREYAAAHNVSVAQPWRAEAMARTHRK